MRFYAFILFLSGIMCLLMLSCSFFRDDSITLAYTGELQGFLEECG